MGCQAEGFELGRGRSRPWADDHSSVYDKVYVRDNREQAWKKVKANKGKPGHDRESIDQFAESWLANLAEIGRPAPPATPSPARAPLTGAHLPRKFGWRIKWK